MRRSAAMERNQVGAALKILYPLKKDWLSIALGVSSARVHSLVANRPGH